jgi:hypothetical protein
MSPFAGPHESEKHWERWHYAWCVRRRVQHPMRAFDR